MKQWFINPTEMKTGRLLTPTWILFLIALTGCQDQAGPKPIPVSQDQPAYRQVGLRATKDTINFPLTEHTYNSIKTFNVFRHNGRSLISFYDKKSETASIYQLQSGMLFTIIDLKKAFKNKKLYKGTVYFKNFDSIFVTNDNGLYLIDTTGHIKRSFDFKEDLWAHFDNTRPPVFIGGHLYAGIRTTAKLKTFKDLRDWRVITDFNLSKGETQTLYQLPEVYLKNYFGYQFLDYSYCLNNKGNLVFSFPADTNIYESNLSDIHHSYSAKSQFQRSAITPVDKTALDSAQDFREYAIRDSYGSIFYDPLRKLYLRQAKQKITLADFNAKTGTRKQSILILDEHFNIVGESEIGADISIDSFLLTPDGNIYARVNPKDEYALHFVKLIYSYEKKEHPSSPIAQSPISAPK